MELLNMHRVSRVGCGCALLFSMSLQSVSAAHYEGPIVDMHAHYRYGDRPSVAPGHAAGTEVLLKLDDAAGVVQSALIVIATKGNVHDTSTQNDAVLKAAKESGGRFFPIVSVHPHDGSLALAELERVAKLGARVVKLHPNTQNFDVADPAVGAVVGRCGTLGLIVLFDSFKPWDADQPGKFLKLALEHQRTRMILAHMGYSQFRQFLAFGMLGKLGIEPNVWFDISAIATSFVDSPLEAEFVWTLRQVGLKRVLFGSDWPIETPAAAANAVRRLGFDEQEQALIFHTNAAALLSSGRGEKGSEPKTAQ
jgi:uncharacterized protein